MSDWLIPTIEPYAIKRLFKMFIIFGNSDNKYKTSVDENT